MCGGRTTSFSIAVATVISDGTDGEILRRRKKSQPIVRPNPISVDAARPGVERICSAIQFLLLD
jgi:hypothetical protein